MQSFDLGGRGSAAYDLGMFQTNTARKKSPPLTVKKPGRDSVARERARARVAMMFRGLLLIAIVVASVVAMLCGYAEMTELNTQISRQKAELATCLTDNDRLKSELEAKLSARNVEEYATQKLGMAALDKSQITYIKLTEGDAVELTEQSSGGGLLDSIKMALGAFKSALTGGE